MTPSSELSASSDAPAPLGDGWREHAQRVQVASMPEGEVVVSCPAPLGSGGLGRHLGEILDALDRGGRPNACVRRRSGQGAGRKVRGEAGRESPGEATCDRSVAPRDRSVAPRDVELTGGWRATLASPLGRTSRAWRMWAESVDFDAEAARRLPHGEHLIAFNGTAQDQFRRSARDGWASRRLVSANSHFRRVVARHELAHTRYPIERPWVTHLLGRNLREYDLADRIYVSSGYIRDSFLEEGHDEQTLTRFPLLPHPRFVPAGEAASSSTFDIVYVGSLLVHKGVPLLLDAVARLPHDDLRVVLVGGPGTRAMRRYLEKVCARDVRITIAPGDPLGPLQRANLCVHPAYEDGFGYAPAEALACGVPVIVSEDTGMKELLTPGRNGVVLPPGELETLAESIDAAYRGELLRG